MRGSLNKEKYVPINSKIQHRLLGKTPPGHLNLLTFSLEFSGLPKVLMGDWTTKLNSRSRFMINTFENAYICSFWSPFRTSHSFTALNFSVSLWKRSQLSNETTWGHPDRPKKLKNLTDTSGSYSLPHSGNGQIPHFADTSVMVKCSGFAPWGGGGGGLEISNWSINQLYQSINFI